MNEELRLIHGSVRANPNWQGLEPGSGRADAWGLYERDAMGHCGRLLLGLLDEATARSYESEVNGRTALAGRPVEES